MINTNILTDLFTRITEAGRSLTGIDSTNKIKLEKLCDYLVSEKGEATGLAIAREILRRYLDLDDEGKLNFFLMLLNHFGTDEKSLNKAFNDWKKNGVSSARSIHIASEPKSIEFISRLNRVKGATSQIVDMRSDLLNLLKDNPQLKPLDNDFKHLLISWFNRGFLELKSIDWTVSAEILERIIKYEAVHEIQGWDDLRRRVNEPDRRLYAYFHPAMVNEPLIFVEVALMNLTPNAIEPILSPDRVPIDPSKAKTAAFYSISNCQPGLGGISFGNFMIKKAVVELQHDVPSIKNFVTLSPIPGLSRWLDEELNTSTNVLNDSQLMFIKNMKATNQLPKNKEDIAKLREIAACFLVLIRSVKGEIYDPVARFHLGNGACLKNINANANVNKTNDDEWKGWGLMVNYEYKLDDIEKNHEAFVNDNVVIHSSEVQTLVKKGSKKG